MPVEDRGAGDDVRRAALPGQRPAAGLVADVVGVAAGDVDVLASASAAGSAALLRSSTWTLAAAARGQRVVRPAADLVEVRPVGAAGARRARARTSRSGSGETASSILLIGTTSSSTSWVRVGMKSSCQPVGLFGACLGSMNMSTPGHDGGLELVGVVPGHLLDRPPVGDHEPVEAQLALEDVGDQLLVGVHLDRVPEPVVGPVDARERRHDGADVVLPHGRPVRRQGRAGRTRVARPGRCPGRSV